MLKLKFIKSLSENQALLSNLQQDQFFVASFANVVYSGPEVLVFPANKDGAIQDWIEVGGGKGYKSIIDFLNSSQLLKP